MKLCKALMIGLVALMLAFCFAACGGGSTDSDESPGLQSSEPDETETAAVTDSTQTATDSTQEKFESLIVLNDATVVTDYEGRRCLAVAYDYTNNGDDSQASIWDFGLKAFQNNVELDSLTMADMDGEWEEWENNSQLEVKPGTTITCCEVFVLQDDSTVEVEAEPLFSVVNAEKTTKTYQIQ